MKYLLLPKHLLQFWYLESLLVFLRIWKNLLLYLEEDLAVRLMLKLLFVPLFHDSSVVGRALSFSFRLSRVLLGAFAISLSTVLLFALAVFWLVLPVWAVFTTGEVGWVMKAVLASGVVLFVHHLITHPHQKVWQIKKAGDIWEASFVKKSDATFSKLLPGYEVKNLLAYLEQTPTNFPALMDNQKDVDVEEEVWQLGKKLAAPYFKPEHFFVAKLSLLPNIDQQLDKLGLTLKDFILVLEFLQLKEESWRVVGLWDEEFKVRHLRGVNRGWLGVPTPSLDAVSLDLTKKASRQYIANFIGRAEIVSQVVNILSLEKGRNVLLVGEPGCGKSVLVEYLAKLIVSGDAPASLATKRLVRLDLVKLLADVKTQGELAEKVTAVFEELKFSGEIIIFVDEIQNLGIGEAGSQFNLYSLMLPFLESDEFQFIGSIEPGSYTKILEKNGSLARLFTKVEMKAASPEETLQILKNQAVEKERYNKVSCSMLALFGIVKLSSEYIHDRVLPDSALWVLESSLAHAQNGWVTKAVIEQVVGSQTHIPVGKVEGVRKKQVLNLENLIHQKMIDQEEAVLTVANTLRRAAADLRDKNKPIGSFLFVGPTGVGKTELAKILSWIYFEGVGQFLRFDMSEYQAGSSIDKLIGKSGEEGLLTESVRHNPYSLILLDEFEKAEPKILTLFLQVLDDGRLTDGTGRTVDFTNTIIIATSNAGSLLVAQGLKEGKSFETVEKQVREELLKAFSPELVNRFDEIVVFKPLSSEDLAKIVRLKLADLQKRLKEQGFLVEFDDLVVAELAKRGFDPVLGARPLRRLIQDTLEATLSRMILEDKLIKGSPLKVSSNFLTEL